ncbi:MAG: recombinase family protein, partial [Dehalococcoidia bacterium]|nr:recombinase family protein [Dehalococcoidia bacterium]
MRNRRNAHAARSSDAVAYARVSTKDQEHEGFSIPAQLRLITEYAAQHGLRIVETFTEVETAGKTGREAFGRMMKLLSGPGRCRTVLVEKTDRLYRNARDMVDLNDLGVEIHFIKEGRVVSEHSRPSDKLVNTILTATAQHFLDNLAEETRKGMLEKARAGLWPSCAPLGYLNVPGPNGKKIIVPDPATAPHVRRLFERYATGRKTLRDITRMAMAEGLVFKRSYRALPSATVHMLLQNPLYMGDMIWDGTRYHGKHEPLVSRELFEQVQDVLHGPKPELPRLTKHDYTYKGLIRCSHCGCTVGAQRHPPYVHYHCSGYKGNCGEPYLREEVLDEAFRQNLERIAPDDEAWEILREEMRKGASRDEESKAGVVRGLENEIASLKRRQDVLYEDRLEGRIDTRFHDTKAIEIRQKVRVLEDKIRALKTPAG